MQVAEIGSFTVAPIFFSFYAEGLKQTALFYRVAINFEVDQVEGFPTSPRMLNSLGYRCRIKPGCCCVLPLNVLMDSFHVSAQKMKTNLFKLFQLN